MRWFSIEIFGTRFPVTPDDCTRPVKFFSKKRSHLVKKETGNRSLSPVIKIEHQLNRGHPKPGVHDLLQLLFEPEELSGTGHRHVDLEAGSIVDQAVVGRGRFSVSFVPWLLNFGLNEMCINHKLPAPSALAAGQVPRVP